MTEPYELQPAWFIAATRDGHVEHCGDCPVIDMLNELLALRPALAAAEAARDTLTQQCTYWMDFAAVSEKYAGLTAEALTAAEQRATRLEALETAARAYVAWLADMEAGRQGIMTGRRLLGTLTAAVAALDGAPAAPGE